ncbi:heptaprenyl diphosphate synthase component 1 [Metabacillus fastidiosus]|uniref:heptaprenyl diphosphate synthase component 1 n=1 Tax=Metabacillus fastidiosus TaxID=1458 RepID=UPI003D295BAF
MYTKLAEIKRKVEKRCAHPFLMKYLSKPKIDEDKLFLFHAIFNELNETDQVKENYIIVAMLVQIALDTHDEVTNSDQIKQSEFVKRQLTVLTGDYFSGLYYSILSGIKDIKMVRTLATAIKEINEHKIKIYENAEADPSALVESLLVIESGLFQKISESFHFDLWKKLSFHFLAYKRLAAERYNPLLDSSSIHHFEYGRIIASPNISQDDFDEQMNHHFNESINLLENRQFHSSVLINTLKERLHSIRFNEEICLNKTVEEGS